jgi:chorismate-pyruvate lyase
MLPIWFRSVRDAMFKVSASSLWQRQVILRRAAAPLSRAQTLAPYSYDTVGRS